MTFLDALNYLFGNLKGFPPASLIQNESGQLIQYEILRYYLNMVDA